MRAPGWTVLALVGSAVVAALAEVGAWCRGLTDMVLELFYRFHVDWLMRTDLLNGCGGKKRGDPGGATYKTVA